LDTFDETTLHLSQSPFEFLVHELILSSNHRPRLLKSELRAGQPDTSLELMVVAFTSSTTSFTILGAAVALIEQFKQLELMAGRIAGDQRTKSGRSSQSPERALDLRKCRAAIALRFS
jgi:hypothetical protein